MPPLMIVVTHVQYGRVSPVLDLIRPIPQIALRSRYRFRIVPHKHMEGEVFPPKIHQIFFFAEMRVCPCFSVASRHRSSCIVCFDYLPHPRSHLNTGFQNEDGRGQMYNSFTFAREFFRCVSSPSVALPSVDVVIAPDGRATSPVAWHTLRQSHCPQ
jgi:hypothetical protein